MPEPRRAWSASPGPVPARGAGTGSLSAPRRGFPASGHDLLLSPGTDLCVITSIPDSNEIETRLLCTQRGCHSFRERLAPFSHIRVCWVKV